MTGQGGIEHRNPYFLDWLLKDNGGTSMKVPRRRLTTTSNLQFSRISGALFDAFQLYDSVSAATVRQKLQRSRRKALAQQAGSLKLLSAVRKADDLKSWK